MAAGSKKVTLEAQRFSTVTNGNEWEGGIVGRDKGDCSGWSSWIDLIAINGALRLTQGAFLPLESLRLAARDLTQSSRKQGTATSTDASEVKAVLEREGRCCSV